ncbi:MAG: hypothetical protein K2H20_03460, partial [Bacilli bacterium]|nr:hypothetical protein [Bacilli bacterium]
MNRKKLLFVITITIVGLGLLLLSFAINKDKKNIFNPDILSNYPDQLYTALYQYSNSDEEFDEYFNNLENSDKLYIGGIIKSPMEEENYCTFPEIESKLNYIFGSTLNVKAEDYYPQKEDVEPMLKYNKETGEY